MRASFLMVPAILAGGLCGLLRADEAPNAAAVPAVEPSIETANAELWFMEHSAAIAKDPEASGIAAVIQASAWLTGRDRQVAIDFFNKALFDTKDHAIQRAIRMELARLYKNAGQNDRAMAQLQDLMDGEAQ